MESMFSSDLNIGKFQCELKLLPQLLVIAQVQRMTKLDSLCDAFVKNPSFSSIYGETVKLLKFYFTVPMTSCSAECSFSALRRLKTYLRQTMSQKSLNTVALCHVYRSRCNDELVKSVCSEFIKKNSNRRNFFGTF